VSFDSLESSVEQSQPREYFTITHGTTTYNNAFASRDLVIGGTIYTAIAAARGELNPAGAGKVTELMLTLPIDHAFCKRYTQQGVPPKIITVVVSRQQSDNSTDQIWAGYVHSMSVDDNCTEATFRCSSRAIESTLRVVPTIAAGKTCPLIWSSARCGVVRSGTGPTGLSHVTTVTVIAVNGRDVQVDLTAIPAADALRSGWATGGELKHIASGEIMTIRTQTDFSPGVSTLATLSLQAQIIGMGVGDSIEVAAGCSREIFTCNAKFGNKQRFGGFPALPTQNPFTPQSWGVVKSL
jgi:hypothetical protein